MNENYEFHCDSCGQSISVTNEQAGIQFNCPSCNAQGVVPANPASLTVASVAPALTTPAPAPMLVPASTPAPASAVSQQTGFFNVIAGNPTVSSISGANPVATQTALLNLDRGKGWVMFMSVITFLSCVGILFTISKLFESISFLKRMGISTAIPYISILFYFIVLVITFFQGLYLAKFSTASGRAALTRSPIDLENAMVSQMKFWRLTGIVLSVMIILMIISALKSM